MQKTKNLLIFLVIITLIPSCTKSPYEGSPKTLAAQKILSKTAKHLGSKHQMKCVGYAYGIMDEVKELGIRFDIQRNLTFDQARLIVLDCAQELVTAVQNEPDIQPFLLETGFQYENIDFIFFVRPKNKFIFFPELGSFSMWDAKIHYWGYDKELFEKHRLPKSISIFSETYTEALEKNSSNLKIKQR